MCNDNKNLYESGDDMADIAIITGATGGIGVEFVKAIHLLDDIDEIWAVGRNNEKLKCLKEEYEKIVPIEADFSADGISVLADRIENEKPNIRILINNAGIAHMGAFEEMKRENIDDFCKINCTAPSMLISIALPYMRTGARILNIASASSFQPNPYLSMYSASKVFLRNLSRALSVELKPKGITVTAVCPGWVDTGMLPKEKNGRPIKYFGMVKPDVVVKKALRDSYHGKDLSTPGFFAGYFRFYSKITPTKLVMKQWTSMIKKYM